MLTNLLESDNDSIDYKGCLSRQSAIYIIILTKISHQFTTFLLNDIENLCIESYIKNFEKILLTNKIFTKYIHVHSLSILGLAILLYYMRNTMWLAKWIHRVSIHDAYVKFESINHILCQWVEPEDSK